MRSERRDALLEILRNSGYVEVRRLPDLLGVSLATVRRDLARLEAEGLAVRTHGGAMLAAPSTSLELPLSAKQTRMVEAKRDIGRLAADLVRHGQTVLLDAGSTTWHVAAELVGRKRVTVVSNDLQVLLRLASDPDITVIDTGGILRQPVFTLHGPHAENFIGGLHADWAFLGADAIDLEAGVTNVNLVEVPIKRAMLRAGRRKVVVADSSKFGNQAFTRVCNLDDLDMVITDVGIAAATAVEYENQGVHLVIADGSAVPQLETEKEVLDVLDA